MTAQETNPAIDILCVVLTVYTIILLARVLISWQRLALKPQPPLTNPEEDHRRHDQHMEQRRHHAA